MKRSWIAVAWLTMGLALAGCAYTSPAATPVEAERTPVTVMLDWVPNTNHTGLFVAAANGYFADAGLEVSIIQPGEVYAEQAVSGGAADFGISFQEQVTLAHAQDIPLVSIAAILQHNTSGFASLAERNVQTPADWEGLRYGSFASPFEAPTLKVLMACAGGDFDRLEVVDTGFTDPLSLLKERKIDLAWIFYGWQGKQAELQGIPLRIVMMEDWTECVPDYYTPVLITSQKTLQERPEIVRSFLQAVSRGYQFAIDDPGSAAAILLQAAPELDPALVRASQAWLSPRYQAEAPRWGEQELGVWQAYADWMLQHGILSQPIDVPRAFTNEFLPPASE
jgi:ABC-type nitrate/sulfonate/bicarbonate transport system substrate-binding protein